MQTELIKILEIGGPAVATAGIFVWYLDRLDKRTNTLICNHFQHITDAMNKNTTVLEKLATIIDQIMKRHKKSKAV